MRNRVYKRYTKRLVGEFSFGDRVFKGISSNISERGLFLKTNNCMVQDSPIDLTFHLSDGNKAIVKGIVRWNIKSNSPLIKNGMGIELLEYDNSYHEFMKASIDKFMAAPLLNSTQKVQETQKVKKAQMQPDFFMIKCTNCGVKNKVRIDRLDKGPKCGKCKGILSGRITN